MPTATIIGSGPNGLSAAITLAASGVETTVLERNTRIGGGCSTAEVTQPGFLHDLGSSTYPLGAASPFYNSLPLTIPWITSQAAFAHPLDDGTAVILEQSIEETVETLDACDRKAYRSLIEPVVSNFAALTEEILGPILHIPRSPFVLARFGLSALLPALSLARSHFAGKRAQALFAGVSTHSILPLETTASAAVGLTMIAAGHTKGWPILHGGAQTLTDALVRHLENLGGRVESGHDVTDLPLSDLVLADITPRQLLRIAGSHLSGDYRNQLERFRYGAGAFKIDYALSAPIPWTARGCQRAATVHIGGSLEEIAQAERTLSLNKPFVLLGQPSLFDSSRAPAGQHTAWAYCHVPNGSTEDYVESIERQIVRYAPGFSDCILSRSVSSPKALESCNPNLVGGDILGGAMNVRQLLFRPTRSLYRTSRTVTAALGLFLTRHLSYNVLSIALIVALSLVFIRLTKSAIGPAISAGVLPLVLGERSWYYPLAIFADVSLLVVILMLWNRYGLCCIDPPKKVMKHNEIVEAHQAIPLNRFWPVGLMTFVILVGAAAQFTGLRFLLFPPVIVMAYEIVGHPTAPDWVRRPVLFPFVCLLTSTIGLLTYDLVQGTVLAVMVTVLCSITILRRFEVHMPPALAVGLLPFVIKMPNYKFPISVFLGTIALVLYWFGYRPILQMLKNT